MLLSNRRQFSHAPVLSPSVPKHTLEVTKDKIMVRTIIKKHPKCLLVELSQSWFVNEHSAVNSLEFVELTPKLFSNSGPSRHSRPTWRERLDGFPGHGRPARAQGWQGGFRTSGCQRPQRRSRKNGVSKFKPKKIRSLKIFHYFMFHQSFNSRPFCQTRGSECLKIKKTCLLNHAAFKNY